MSRYSAGVRTSAGSTTLPIASLYAATATRARLMEVHIFKTTATEVALKLSRLDTAGTKPGATTDNPYDPAGPAADCTFHGTHTVGPTIDEENNRGILGAAIGSGIIWTFGDTGLIIPVGTANGIGVVVATGTGQICDVTFVWEE